MSKREYPRVEKGVVLYGPQDEPENRKPANPHQAAPTGPLDVNTATAEQLAEIDALSDANARSIVDYRDEHGAFTSIAANGDDKGLTAVKGIGDTKAEKLADGILVVNPLEKLNVNDATAEQLDEVSGLGKELAEAIVNSVQAKGPFTSIAKTDDDEGLTVIPGIAEESAEALYEYLTV